VSFLRSHMVLMFLYAAFVAAFFSLLWRSERKQRIKLFITIFCSLVLGGILLGWLMFPAPYK